MLAAISAAWISRLPSPCRAMCVLVFGALSLPPTAAWGAAHEPFHPPQGALIAGLRETAAHRPALPPLRLSRQHDTQEDLGAWLHIDPQGRVLEAHGTDKTDVDPAEFEKALRNLRYTPFTRDGVAVEVWAQDSFSVLEVEDLPAHTVPFPRTSDLSAVAMRLSRTGCSGGCPVYSVTIHGDGSIVYAGDHTVSIAGTHNARISAADFAALLERFRKASFLALKDSYRSEVADRPTYYLSVNLPGKTKVVADYAGGSVGMPAVVTELENAVDLAADSARWVTSSPGTVAAMREAGIAVTSPQAARILRAAVGAGDSVTARALLAEGTSASAPRDSSLLELAADSDNAGGQLEMLQLLLSSPAVRADQAGKQRALARAVQYGEVDLARVLIAAGADPAERFVGVLADTEQNETYLMLAASSGVWAMIEDALARPHDIHAVDGQGHTALVGMVLSAPPMRTSSRSSIACLPPEPITQISTVFCSTLVRQTGFQAWLREAETSMPAMQMGIRRSFSLAQTRRFKPCSMRGPIRLCEIARARLPLRQLTRPKTARKILVLL